jgi:RNA polymerase sigma-70 factor (ECF subfamily)
MASSVRLTMSTCDTHVTESGTLAFRVALSVLRHREDAEDVAQEAVVRSLQRFDSLRDRTRFRAWLVRITWRLALDRRRSDARRAARDFRSIRAEGNEGSAEHQALERERAAQLWAAIDQLPLRLRLPLVLSTLQGQTVEEVASLLEVPVGTVKSRMFEARQRLKRVLIGTGVFIAFSGLILSLISMPRVHDVETAEVVSRVAVVTPNVAAGPARVSNPHVQPNSTSVPASTSGPAIEADLPPVAALQVPIVDVSSLGLKALELPTITVSVVHLPVVDIKSVEVPTVKNAVVATSDPHQEK